MVGRWGNSIVLVLFSYLGLSFSCYRAPSAAAQQLGLVA